MTAERIKELQEQTGYPQSISVYKALLQVWNECEQNGNDFISDVSSRFYQIDFGNHLRCKLKITDGEIEVEGAINGWGDDVPLDEVVILELNDC